MRAARVVAAAAAALLVAGCAALLAPPDSAREPASLDRALASAASPVRAIVVEVDWLTGYEPSRKALEGARERLAEWCPGKVVLVERDDEIDDAELCTALGGKAWMGSGPERALLARAFGQAPAIEDASPAIAAIQVVYISFSALGIRGVCGDSIGIFLERIREHAVLWLTAATIERTVLIHELGHWLGFGHCPRPDCVMYEGPPDARAILANLPRAFFTGTIPDDLCKLCRRDLESARLGVAAK